MYLPLQYVDQLDDCDDEPPSHQAPDPPMTRSRSRSTSSAGRLNVADLGFHDPVDVFWRRRVDLSPLSSSEQNLLDQLRHQRALAALGGPLTLGGPEDSFVGGPRSLQGGPVSGGFGISDAVSYEDLMEFALDGPPRHCRLG